MSIFIHDKIRLYYQARYEHDTKDNVIICNRKPEPLLTSPKQYLSFEYADVFIPVLKSIEYIKRKSPLPIYTGISFAIKK
ncbi:11502_t:CDS:2 [Diversispora eburnea]|uniref:11502_t:CDS:1 n=1 Tax=Diversispora eburnea TaxID=1213867 RepID=A0A9N8UZG8_9GLOM|nr:11502_t:CDS:2 [Diversispora eburnea]